MANETVTAGLGEVIHANAIPEFLASHRYGPDLSSLIAWAEPVGPGKGTNYRFNVVEPFAVPAGTKVEGTGVFPNREFGVSDSIAQSGVVGFGIDISREARYDAVPGIPRAALEGAIDAIRARLNTDLLGVVQNATSSTGAAGDTLTVANFAAGIAEAETLNPKGGLVAVIGSEQPWEDLLGSMVTTSTTLLPAAGGPAVARPGVGVKGQLFGTTLATSPHVATEAGTPDARNNVIIEPGRGRSGLCLAVWQPIQAEFEPKPGNYADVWWVHARYGVVANNDCVLTEMLSRAA